MGGIKQSLKRLMYTARKRMYRPSTVTDINAAGAVACLETHRPHRPHAVFRQRERKPSAVDLAVIVAAYNVAPYIDECLASMAAQETSYTFHVIVVDDGSTDETPEHLAVYEKDPRFTIIHQPNGGLSAARNTGLAQHDGRYVMFVDGDDMIPDPHTFEKMLSMAADTIPIVASRFLNYYPHRAAGKQFEENQAIARLVGKVIDPRGELPGFACGKIFRRELFDGMSFPVQYHFEDTMIKWLIYPKAMQAAVCDAQGYAYRKNRPGSITQQSRKNTKAIDALWLTLDYLSVLAEKTETFGLAEKKMFLAQATIDIKRILGLEDKVVQSAFVILKDLYDRYFQAIPSSETGTLSYWHREAEQALVSGDEALMRLVARYY